MTLCVACSFNFTPPFDSKWQRVCGHWFHQACCINLTYLELPCPKCCLPRGKPVITILPIEHWGFGIDHKGVKKALSSFVAICIPKRLHPCFDSMHSAIDNGHCALLLTLEHWEAIVTTKIIYNLEEQFAKESQPILIKRAFDQEWHDYWFFKIVVMDNY